MTGLPFPARLLAPLAALAVAALALAACSSAGEGASDGGLRVVTTVSPITSIVENVGGDRVDVEGIVPEGVNSHTFEPRPSDARVLSRADLIIVNGLHLEEPTLELAEASRKDGTPILKLGDNTITEDEYIFDFSFPKDQGDPNPHLWMNPAYAMRYAELVRDELARLDPEGADYYRENADTYLERLRQLDDAIRQAVATIPPENRRLLTYHDSWAYFARRYNLEVIGAVQPSDFSEPSARDVARVIEQVREARVPAVFGSEVFPSEVLEQIARETDAKYIDQLRDDDLPGEPGDPEHSYIGLMLEDMEIMIPALGGSVGALQGVDPSPVAGNTARYPQ